ncbi:hypothetical protein NDU88_002927 [Pleurodeles waltl]|uniref:Uncharacterized protein n=1 Tax=Pleurodeles waltl TaxID=8319 RepID=A0AAV7NF58_PLEWA|nr:hypothetical protein NDU88_002927 [Pleurodeles waltl]
MGNSDRDTSSPSPEPIQTTGGCRRDPALSFQGSKSVQPGSTQRKRLGQKGAPVPVSDSQWTSIRVRESTSPVLPRWYLNNSYGTRPRLHCFDLSPAPPQLTGRMAATGPQGVHSTTVSVPGPPCSSPGPLQLSSAHLYVSPHQGLEEHFGPRRIPSATQSHPPFTAPPPQSPAHLALPLGIAHNRAPATTSILSSSISSPLGLRMLPGCAAAKPLLQAPPSHFLLYWGPGAAEFSISSPGSHSGSSAPRRSRVLWTSIAVTFKHLCHVCSLE